MVDGGGKEIGVDGKMKQQSYFYTMEQFLARRKDITRRKKCQFSPGEHYYAVDRMQGLKKGQKRLILGECECLSNVPEKVEEIIKRPVRASSFMYEWESARLCCRHIKANQFGYWCGRTGGASPCKFAECTGIHEVDREGSPELTPEQFADKICAINHITYRDIVQRVVFRRCD